MPRRAPTPVAILSPPASPASGREPITSEERLTVSPPTHDDREEHCDYEAPAIIFEKVIEAVANTCAFDPPLTKSNAGEGCTGLTFS